MCIPHVLTCLEDRNPEVRKKAQESLVPFMIHVGYDTVFRATSKLKVQYEPVHEKTNNLGSDTNQAVQSQKIDRRWKFWI